MPRRAIERDFNFEQRIRVYKLCSRLIALLPFEGRDFDFIGTRLLTAFMLLNSVIFSSMQIGYFIDALVQRRPLQVEDVYVAILSNNGLIRYYMLLWFRKSSAELFEECGRLWEFCDAKGRATLVVYESKLRFVYGIYAASYFLSSILIPIGAYLARLPASGPNATEQRVLPYRWFVEDEPYRFLGYHATFVIQSSAIQNGMFAGLVCEATVPGFVMLGAGYFHQLKDRLADCCERDESTRSTEAMRCIEYHQKLIKYCNNVKNLSPSMLLTQILAPCYSISLILIKLIGNDSDKFSHLPIIGICMCQLFLINWTPDLLADQSVGVSFGVYSVLMKKLSDKRLVRNLYTMLIRAQTPVIIMAGGFVVLSLETYGSMLNGAFSFFMVLRTLGI